MFSYDRLQKNNSAATTTLSTIAVMLRNVTTK